MHKIFHGTYAVADCKYTTYNIDQWLYQKLLVCTTILWAGVGVGVQIEPLCGAKII